MRHYSHWELSVFKLPVDVRNVLIGLNRLCQRVVVSHGRNLKPLTFDGELHGADGEAVIV